MTIATSPARVRVLADLLPGTLVLDLVLVLAGTAFITAAGHIAVPLPFTPVPISLATFAVLLTGAALGPLRGTASAGVYLVAGVAGVPLFADGRSGWAFASFGYIVGFVAAALVVGTLARHRADRHVLSTAGLAALGSLTIYVFGVPWLAVSLGVDLGTAIMLGVVPFLIGDALKVVAAAALLPGTWRLVNRWRH